MTLEDRPVRASPTVLVVDDTPVNIELVRAVLHETYIVRDVPDGESCLDIARSEQPPDLILLDVVMPGMDGHEVCRRLKADAATRDIPVVFLTAKDEDRDEELGLQLGAVDYITKPISPAILKARVQAQLRVKQAADFLRDKTSFLQDEVARRTAKVSAIQDVTTLVMASLAETRDSETSNHIRRTQYYVKTLAWRLSTHPRFSALLTPTHIDLMHRAAALHDIGKVGIPDRILLKPGKLSPEEFEIMKAHTTLGRDAIANAERALGVNVDYLSFAKEIAYSHHEKWDGTGYPEGLAGDAIPVSGRLMALADVYDALISRRVHKEAMPHVQAVQIIQQTRGRHFDPAVVDAFLASEDNFQAIAAAYADSSADLCKKARYADLAKV